ncbi:hypothetical protein RIMD111065_12570 [Aeromonas hydrophila]|nr:STAS-like domain-containing protein [Aeromonas hydrophila]BCO12901.1 hypothetical protein RIMD111065_12570 [Aeromonas hydrophila]
MKRKIAISELIGRNAISMASGNKLYNEMKYLINEDIHLVIDFTGVEYYASPFFNSSFGLLLKDISIERLKSHVKIDAMNDTGRSLLNLVIDNAITFYKNKDTITKIISDHQE